MTKKYFDQLASSFFSLLKSNSSNNEWGVERSVEWSEQVHPIFNELVSLNLHYEDTLFVRFNQGLVRQNTHVLQPDLTILYQCQIVTEIANPVTTASTTTAPVLSTKEIKMTINLSGHENFDNDFQALQLALQKCRQMAPQLPTIAFPTVIQNNGQSNNQDLNAKAAKMSLPSYETYLHDITECLEPSNLDLAGFLTSGKIIIANKNSLGQDHWFATENFFFDYSLYTVNAAKENKSIKGCYSGLTWDKNILKQKIEMAAQQLTVLQKASKSIQTGKYRVYLAPAAVAEIMDLIRWGFGYEYYKDGNSPFKDLYEKNKSFSPLFHLQENFSLGFGPRFNSLGEISSEQIPLIQNGQMKNLLVSSRSALEYKLESNQADVYECMRAPEISPGALSTTDIFSELGTGIYINNLHYLNYSDVPSAKITGMTRYACFWVQDGQIEAPIQDMRFDASLYDIFGSDLVAITSHAEVAPDVLTYDQRAVGASKTPGMIIKNFPITL